MRSLQCVRALAAGLVVYFHATLQIAHFRDPSGGPATLSFPCFGAAGVDIFFVLSGFLIWCSTRERPEVPRSFLIKRVLRIAPLYWLVTLLAAGTALLIPSLLHSTRFDLAHVLASLAFIPWPNPASSGTPVDLMTPVIVPGWTLNFEMAFYVLFGLCLLVPTDRRLAAALLAYGGTALALAIIRGDNLLLSFYDPGLVLEFLLGLCLGACLNSGLRVPRHLAAAAAAGGLALLVALELGGIGLHRFWTAGCPAALLILGLASLEKRGFWPALPAIEAVGDATYSLYLTHVFVLAGARMVAAALHLDLDPFGWQACFLLCGIAASIAVGLLTYRLVERPLGAALRGFGAPRSLPAIALAGAPK